ncbi:hypothetical protein WJX82_000883 [Trebouxia sp. C0006]
MSDEGKAAQKSVESGAPQKAEQGELTLFDKIVSKQIPATILFEDETALAFKDINPQAPVHFLVIPKNRDGLTQLSNCSDRHEPLLGHLIRVASKVALQEGCEKGFRTVINDGPQGCQSVLQCLFAVRPAGQGSAQQHSGPREPSRCESLAAFVRQTFPANISPAAGKNCRETMEAADSSAPSTVVVKIVKVSPATAPNRNPESQHTVSILNSTGEARISFSAVYQPCNLLERPKVFHQDVLASLLAPESSQYAVRTALETFMAHRNQTSFPVLTEMFEDSLGLSEGLTVLQLENSYNALLVALDADQDEELLPPEGFINAGPITPEGAPVDNAAELSAADRALLIQPPGLTSAKELLRIATTPQQQAAAPLPAGAVMTAPSDGLGEDRPEGQAGANWGSKSFLLVWADTAEPVRLTPSVLLAHLILCSRREAGMFLRMASGLGYCQVGDYVASLFFLFRRRGHRLKCWECGVKKKAPCGQTQRDDLPWCCHRRLGEWIALHTVTRADNAQKSITFESNGTFFLSLLPPKKVLDAGEPVAAQLQFQPQAAEVVRLSEIMKERPFHPSMTLQKALTRLAPTCRKLWNQMDWITATVAQVVGERSEPAAAKLHLWLERTAFYKVPKSHQDEVSDQCQKPFEQLIDELLPVVAGAPNLGGHNRSGESIKATKAKQKMQQTQPGSDAPTAAALARRAGSYSGNVAQVPNAGALQTSMGLPQGAAWDQAPLLVRVDESEAGQQPANLPFPAAEHPADVISQGIDSATQLSTTPYPSGTTPGSAEGVAVPLGMEGWGEGHMPGVYGVAEGAAGNGNIGQQPAAAEPADGAQTDTPVTREYTINGKRKPLTNTGQGRRRLNARAALRAAGQDRQLQAATLASPPQVANPIVAVRNPSLDTESSGSRKSKAMAGAYSSTYSKLQAQGQLLHPSMQLAMAEAGVSASQDLMMSEADRAAAEADPAAFFKQRALGPNNLGAPSGGSLEDAGVAMQSTLLDAPHLLQGKQLRLGKKSKRGERDGNDTESADEQTGSPLHVLSDIAQREGELEARPGAAPNDTDSQSSPRMQTRSGGNAAAGQAVQNSPRHRLQQVSHAEELQALQGPATQALQAASSIGQGVPSGQEQMPTALQAQQGSAPAAALPAASEGGTRHSKRQALAKADSPGSDSIAPAPDTEDTSSLKQAIGGDVPRRKRERTSRLGRKAGHKPKVDRFHYLFEAIEADKASDSETANGTGSRLSEGAEPDSAQATSRQPDQDTGAQAEPRDPGVVQSQETQQDTGSGAEKPAGDAKQAAVGPAGNEAVGAADQAAHLQSDAAQTVVAGQSSWPGALHQSLVPLSMPLTSAQAHAQSLQGYAQQPQGQAGIGVYPQYCGGMQQQAGMMPDYQMGFGYLLTAPQLPPGAVYQQIPVEAPGSAPFIADSDAQPALPTTITQAGRGPSHTATDQQAGSVGNAAAG